MVLLFPARKLSPAPDFLQGPLRPPGSSPQVLPAGSRQPRSRSSLALHAGPPIVPSPPPTLAPDSPASSAFPQRTPPGTPFSPCRLTPSCQRLSLLYPRAFLSRTSVCSAHCRVTGPVLCTCPRHPRSFVRAGTVLRASGPAGAPSSARTRSARGPGGAERRAPSRAAEDADREGRRPWSLSSNRRRPKPRVSRLPTGKEPVPVDAWVSLGTRDSGLELQGHRAATGAATGR